MSAQDRTAAEDVGVREAQRILVVDDDEDFRMIVAATLARNGFDAAEAGDSDAAFERCSTWKPHLILMDVQMPGRSGLQACLTFRQAELTADVPIILMSAHWRDEQQLLRAFDVGADDVLSKEQSALELLARVQSVLRFAAVRRRASEIARDVRAVEGFLAVCAACKRVRDANDRWEEIELAVKRLTGMDITHGICPGCRERLYAGDTEH